MPNMTYCAFENTYGEVRQCIELLEEELNEEFTLSTREWEYAQDLAKKAAKLQRLVAELESRRDQRTSPDGVMR